jgi:hypothetical protein
MNTFKRRPGAPLKYGEPTKKKMFRLPVSFWEKLRLKSLKEGKSIGEIILEKFGYIPKKRK